VPVDENGELDLDAFAKAMTKKTKLVTFFHVSNVLGTINDVKKLVAVVRRKSKRAKVLVDGAQAVPHMPVDISRLDCDFYAFSAHKMLGPTGVGVLWGRRAVLEEMPPFQFGGDMISDVKIKKSTWAPIPIKFEAGTPNIEGAVGFGAAVGYLNKIGMANVREHEVELTKYALKRLSEVKDIRILGPREAEKRCGVIAFALDTVPPHDVASILDSEGIEIRSGYNCAEPLMDFLGTGPVARASFYIYNTKKEVDRFIEGLKKVERIFKK
jgi:cysteine desulfurase/selenocysteine lyase